MNDRLDNELLTKYSDYLVDNYIGDDCNYPPSLRAALSASLPGRRTRVNHFILYSKTIITNEHHI